MIRDVGDEKTASEVEHISLLTPNIDKVLVERLHLFSICPLICIWGLECTSKNRRTSSSNLVVERQIMAKAQVGEQHSVGIRLVDGEDPVAEQQVSVGGEEML